jgi:hypothetical protein
LRAAAEADALTKDVLKLRVGLKGLNFVLENWEDETTKCNYAQLDRALLARDKKEELLEAATTNALFDKDNKYMIIKCKRNPGAIKEVAAFITYIIQRHSAVPGARVCGEPTIQSLNRSLLESC